MASPPSLELEAILGSEMRHKIKLFCHSQLLRNSNIKKTVQLNNLENVKWSISEVLTVFQTKPAAARGYGRNSSVVFGQDRPGDILERSSSKA